MLASAESFYFMGLDLRTDGQQLQVNPEANTTGVAVSSNRISAGLGSAEGEIRLGYVGLE
jgi:hypothetical protein